jgi:hypothetical protein
MKRMFHSMFVIGAVASGLLVGACAGPGEADEGVESDVAVHAQALVSTGTLTLSAPALHIDAAYPYADSRGNIYMSLGWDGRTRRALLDVESNGIPGFHVSSVVFTVQCTMRWTTQNGIESQTFTSRYIPLDDWVVYTPNKLCGGSGGMQSATATIRWSKS